MNTKINKFLMSLLPAVTMGGAYLGTDISPEWYEATVVSITPLLVWAIPNAT